jgi:phosphohistidine phosphatase
MQLYFFRHALAQDHDLGIPDAQRALVSRGIQRTEITAKALKALGVKPDLLYSSPLVRARQTADILSSAFGVPVQEREEIAPGFNAAAVETLITGVDRQAAIMFVGHEPDLSMTIQAISGGHVDMKKGGVALIEVTRMQPVRGMLQWLIPPKIFDRGDGE